jgi:hypothetical protein
VIGGTKFGSDYQFSPNWLSGAGGRRVVIMTATLTGDVATALYEALS